MRWFLPRFRNQEVQLAHADDPLLAALSGCHWSLYPLQGYLLRYGRIAHSMEAVEVVRQLEDD